LEPGQVIYDSFMYGLVVVYVCTVMMTY